MDNKKLAKLMQDKAFMEKILEATTETEVKKLFSEHGFELNEGDIEFLAKAISKAAKNEGQLSEKDLEGIAGGMSNAASMAIGVGIGAGTMLLPAAIAAAWAFKKGQDYALSWWKYFNTSQSKNQTQENSSQKTK